MLVSLFNDFYSIHFNHKDLFSFTEPDEKVDYHNTGKFTMHPELGPHSPSNSSLEVEA